MQHINQLKSKAKSLAKSLWQDESAQGATEYILLLVVVVTLAFMFKDKIKKAFGSKLDDVGNGMDSFKVEQ